MNNVPVSFAQRVHDRAKARRTRMGKGISINWSFWVPTLAILLMLAVVLCQSQQVNDAISIATKANAVSQKAIKDNKLLKKENEQLQQKVAASTKAPPEEETLQNWEEFEVGISQVIPTPFGEMVVTSREESSPNSPFNIRVYKWTDSSKFWDMVPDKWVSYSGYQFRLHPNFERVYDWDQGKLVDMGWFFRIEWEEDPYHYKSLGLEQEPNPY